MHFGFMNIIVLCIDQRQVLLVFLINFISFYWLISSANVKLVMVPNCEAGNGN
jgi:hypothetical protein